MANIAVVFHWPPSEMVDMSLEELSRWHELALDRAPKTDGPDE
ncbi:GpE family phage tail protein [Maritimibacter sp. HL-12]|nr:GpE family phage tail protein [Maritimibacter sp. HL-12]SMH35747.1 Phage P2 GpE [Maritimibacter sp. HL-12]